MNQISYGEFIFKLISFLNENPKVNRLPVKDFGSNIVDLNNFNDFMSKAIFDGIILAHEKRISLNQMTFLSLRLGMNAKTEYNRLKELYNPKETNVVYLLGAGASINAIPIVSGMTQGMKDMVEILKTYKNQLSDKSWESDIENSPNEILDEFIFDFEILISDSEKNNTIDEYASELFEERDKKQYDELKRILSVYITLQQYSSNVDKRYKGFISKLKENERTLNPKVKIMSWNYDTQMELAYSHYYKYNGWYDAKRNLLVNQKYVSKEINKELFTLTKVNGTANILQNALRSRTIDYCSTNESGLNNKVVDEILRNYYYSKNQTNKYWCGLSFAWEEFDDDNFLDDIKDIFKNATHLVIIGYSFPDYNKKLDKQIIGNVSGLKEVIIQVGTNDFSSVEFRIKKYLPKDFEGEIISMSPDQFYVPLEL